MVSFPTYFITMFYLIITSIIYKNKKQRNSLRCSSVWNDSCPSNNNEKQSLKYVFAARVTFYKAGGTHGHAFSQD